MPATRGEEDYYCEQCGRLFHPFTCSLAKRFCSTKCTGDNRRSKPLSDRFFEKLEKLPSGCWSIGSGSDKCYAVVFFDGKQLHGHRVSWILHKGPIPDGMFVCHNCPGGDNRWCVNPDHLFLGNLYMNNKDTLAKNRHNKTACAKLREDQVLAILSSYRSGVSKKHLQEQYGVSEATIKRIIYGRSWRWVQCKADPHASI